MSQQNKKRRSRVKNLIVVCSLSAIILIVSTYAWFIGLQAVNVTSFDVEIASAESLLLSLDGSRWSSTVSISKATLDDVSYANNTNNWGGEGLIPMSSIGEMDSTVSRMKLYEIAGLTATPGGLIATPGGYRLMSSRVKNYSTGSLEQNGYVVFDLFIRNFTGTQYIAELNQADEEAIYLTTDSTVSVASTGVANTGIENSVRVAFAQIGRVAGTVTDASTITKITCSDSGTGTSAITGICRTAQIWEPNDIAHEKNAISWYDEQCSKRTGVDFTKAASYSGSCGTVVNGNSYNTYAVSDDIASSDKVDIYDGADYNSYTTTTLTGSCTGGTAPTTEAACHAATGIWDGSACKANNNQTYCSAIGGTFAVPTPIATCTGGTVPTTQSTCETAGGAWTSTGEDTGTCAGNSKPYCTAIGGTYTAPTQKLYAYPYFTDTMKIQEGTTRPSFMTLAPNSITKVRIYIYIEGQDIDNYDYASLGKKIAVKFGFTKQRLTQADISYNGPDLGIGKCTGGTIPTTQSTCTAKGGTWNVYTSTCSGSGEDYCESIGGTYTPVSSITGSTTGTCASGTVPTTAATCTAAYGTWTPGQGETPGTCAGTTKRYCDTIGGTFTADVVLIPAATVGTCTDGTALHNATACSSAGGTWTAETSTCTGNTKGYCDAIGGTFSIPGTCAGSTETYCTAIGGTWANDACTGGTTPTTQTSCTDAEGTWTPTGE